MCNGKHTRYNPTEEEFVCPKCGAKCGDFFIAENFGDDECELLHDDDCLQCSKCEYTISGKSFVKKLLKDKCTIACPTCGGSGELHGATADQHRTNVLMRELASMIKQQQTVKDLGGDGTITPELIQQCVDVADKAKLGYKSSK